jgi:heme/copper-type cytochrome/quinol oxidase subunit 4
MLTSHISTSVFNFHISNVGQKSTAETGTTCNHELSYQLSVILTEVQLSFTLTEVLLSVILTEVPVLCVGYTDTVPDFCAGDL